MRVQISEGKFFILIGVSRDAFVLSAGVAVVTKMDG